MSSIHNFTRVAVTIAVLSTLVACSKEQSAQQGQPPTEVAIVTVDTKPLAVTTELPGRIEATRIAQVRARVSGIVLQRTFREGSEVKSGEVLFRIDPAQYKASSDSALATLAKAEANLSQATLKAQRYKPLVEVHAISKQEFDDATSAQKQAEADVAAAKAAVQTANLNLGYATVTSPISGRIGRAQVTEGALVGQGDATVLATVQQLNPIYVNLTQSSSDLLKLRKAMADGELKSVGPNQAGVTLIMENGEAYPHTGKLLFSDVTVDEGTNTVSLRAEFPNPDRALLPGMYVRTKLDQAIDETAITVPQQAVQHGPTGASVMVVGADNKVAARPVTTGASYQTQWIITDGLDAGDRVIVEGLQKTAPGATVTPVPWKSKQTPPTTSAQPAANKQAS
jgi:membrane fusion protein (multidrug efflux system)